MKNLSLYNHRVSVLFNKYLNEQLSLEELISGLEKIQEQLGAENSGGSLWFKLSEDDTLATSIDDLEKDLICKRNRTFTLERMEEAINLENELFIYYS